MLPIDSGKQIYVCLCIYVAVSSYRCRSLSAGASAWASPLVLLCFGQVASHVDSFQKQEFEDLCDTQDYINLTYGLNRKRGEVQLWEAFFS